MSKISSAFAMLKRGGVKNLYNEIVVRFLLKKEASFAGDEGFVKARDITVSLMEEEVKTAKAAGDEGALPRRKRTLSVTTLAGLNASKPRIAIQAHVFNVDVLPELVTYMNSLPEAFDLFVSTDTSDKKREIENILKAKCNCRRYEVSIFENRGRDVAPFILQMKDAIGRYEYICHIHSKKSVHTDEGDDWRKANLSALFDNSKVILDFLDTKKSVGLLFPQHPANMNDFMIWMGSLKDTRAILDRVYRFLDIEGKIPASSIDDENAVRGVKLPVKPEFPAGNMFWAKSAAISPLFKCGISGVDFQPEYGQLSHTTAHAIERCWVYLVGLKGYESVRVH